MNSIELLVEKNLVIPIFSSTFTMSPSLYHLCAFLVTQSCLTLCVSMDCNPQSSSVHGDSPGKNTGVGYHALFQGYHV